MWGEAPWGELPWGAVADADAVDTFEGAALVQVAARPPVLAAPGRATVVSVAARPAVLEVE